MPSFKRIWHFFFGHPESMVGKIRDHWPVCCIGCNATLSDELRHEKHRYWDWG